MHKEKLYDVIYADPPWRYTNAPPRKADAIEAHYSTMSLEEIKAMDISAKPIAVLWLWATSPLLPEALEVMKAWDFVYKSCAVWDKETIGLGYWFRQQHELLLVGSRGGFKSPYPKGMPSVIKCKRGRHSEKPWEVREYLTKIYKGLDKIELFARTDGELFVNEEWDYWGNESSNESALQR